MRLLPTVRCGGRHVKVAAGGVEEEARLRVPPGVGLGRGIPVVGVLHVHPPQGHRRALTLRV